MTSFTEYHTEIRVIRSLFIGPLRIHLNSVFPQSSTYDSSHKGGSA